MGQSACAWIAGIILVPSLSLASAVKVAQDGQSWVIDAPQRHVTIDTKEFSVQITAGPAQWNLSAAENALTVLSRGVTFELPLTAAAEANFSPYHNGSEDGVDISLSGFAHENKPVDLELHLRVCIEPTTSDLIWHIVAIEHEAKLREIRWPKLILPKLVERTVLPFMQGMLLPRDWPQRVTPYETIAYGRGLYMPWWGQQSGESCVVTILQTPWDGGYVFDHPAGGP